ALSTSSRFSCNLAIAVAPEVAPRGTDSQAHLRARAPTAASRRTRPGDAGFGIVSLKGPEGASEVPGAPSPRPGGGGYTHDPRVGDVRPDGSTERVAGRQRRRTGCCVSPWRSGAPGPGRIRSAPFRMLLLLLVGPASAGAKNLNELTQNFNDG